MHFIVFTPQEHYFKWEMTLLELRYLNRQYLKSLLLFQLRDAKAELFLIVLLIFSVWVTEDLVAGNKNLKYAARCCSLSKRTSDWQTLKTCLSISVFTWVSLATLIRGPWCKLFKCFLGEELFSLQKIEIIPVHFYLFLQRWCYKYF